MPPPRPLPLLGPREAGLLDALAHAPSVHDALNALDEYAWRALAGGTRVRDLCAAANRAVHSVSPKPFSAHFLPLVDAATLFWRTPSTDQRAMSELGGLRVALNMSLHIFVGLMDAFPAPPPRSRLLCRPYIRSMPLLQLKEKGC